MADVIDMNTERNRREQPDPEFISQDDYGRKLYVFLLSYQMDGKEWSTQIWAYDAKDAERRVTGMRESLKVDGQLFTQVSV